MILVTTIFYAEHELNLSPFLIGIVGAAYGMTYLITPAILGRIGDKIPRKTSLIIASVGHLLTSMFFMIFARSAALLITGQILLGIFYGFYWPSIEAYSSESSLEISERSHKKGILSFCIGWSIGYMFGPLFAGFLSEYFLPGAFLSVIVIYAFEVILVVFSLPKITDSARPNDTISNSNHTKKKSNTIFIQLVLTVFLYAATSKVLYIYFVDYATEVSVLNWTDSTIGIVLFVFGLGRTTYFILSYYWAKLRSSMKLNIFTFLGMAICITIIPFFNRAVIISIIMFFGGVTVAIIYSSTLDLMLHKEYSRKGAKAGIFESMVGLGSILTPIIAGILAERISFDFPFYVIGGVIFIVFVVFLMLELKMKEIS